MMKIYEVKTSVTLTVQPGSIVILSDEQAAAAHGFITKTRNKQPAPPDADKEVTPDADKEVTPDTSED